MALVRSHRLRTFLLILALALGLVGRVFAPAAMAMPSGTTPGATAEMTVAISSSGTCAACADHSSAMLSDCSVGLCSAVAAILPAGNRTVSTRMTVDFVRAAESAAQGITFPPALGPPRLLHFT